MSIKRSTRLNHSIISIPDSEEEILPNKVKERKKRTIAQSNLISEDETDTQKPKRKKFEKDHEKTNKIPSSSLNKDNVVSSKSGSSSSTLWEIHELLAEQFSLDIDRCRSIVR